jgi:hypothetical protein
MTFIISARKFISKKSININTKVKDKIATIIGKNSYSG